MNKIVNISKGNRKVGKIPSVSLTPIKACGNCGSCRKTCYALKAYRMYTNVKKAYDNNLNLALKDSISYFRQIDDYCLSKKPKFFRWHISGDILDQIYLDSMNYIARNNPTTRFLCFTKMHHLNFESIHENLQIVFSMFPSMNEPENKRFPKAWMNDGTEKRIPEDAIHCFGNCESCGMCWQLSKIKKDVYFDKH